MIPPGKCRAVDYQICRQDRTRKPDTGIEKMVPKGGLEPPRVTSHAPQTCASTNSATSARSGRMSIGAQASFACGSPASVPARATSYFLDGCGDAGVSTLDVGCATGAAGDGDA
jgi:hypothetical protein